MLTFVYTTCRPEPKLEWFTDSLFMQLIENKIDPKTVQFILVDYELQYNPSRREKLYDDRIDFLHVEPKPCAWQGKYKITKTNWFCAGLARNTGICYTKNDYLFFIDDTCILAPGSLRYMLECAKKKVVCGFSYRKVFDLKVEYGNIVSKRDEAGGVDSRITSGGDAFRRIGGGQLWGYNGSPISVLLSVNGYDEICNSMGGEDYHYGTRIEKLGIPVYYTTNVLFYESEDLASQEGCFFPRRDPFLGEDRYKELMQKYDVKTRWYTDGRYDLSHLILDMLMRGKTWTEGNNYNLTHLRDHILSGGSFSTEFSKDLKSIDDILLTDISYYRDGEDQVSTKSPGNYLIAQ